MVGVSDISGKALYRRIQDRGCESRVPLCTACAVVEKTGKIAGRISAAELQRWTSGFSGTECIGEFELGPAFRKPCILQCTGTAADIEIAGIAAENRVRDEDPGLDTSETVGARRRTEGGSCILGTPERAEFEVRRC